MKSKNELLFQNIKDGNLEQTKILLDEIDPSIENNQAIRIASEKGDTAIVGYLLQDERIDPTVEDNFPLGIALLHEHEDTAQLLLKDKRVIRYGIHDILCSAIIYGKARNIHSLIEKNFITDSMLDNIYII
jgi:hypothetical protein